MVIDHTEIETEIGFIYELKSQKLKKIEIATEIEIQEELK